MIRDISFGQYYPADSPLHRMDPRAKITSLFLLYIGVFFLDRGISYGIASALCLGLMAYSRVPAKVYWRSTV